MAKVNENSWLITIDCDGTLVGDKLGADMASTEVGDLITEVYKELSAQGHKLCLNTGRVWDLCEPIYNKLGMDEPLILMNGTHLLMPKGVEGDADADSFEYNDHKLSSNIIDEMINNEEWGQYIVSASGMSPGTIQQALVNLDADETGSIAKMREGMGNAMASMKINMLEVDKVTGDHNSLSVMFADKPGVREKVVAFLDTKDCSHRIYDEVSPPGIKWVEIGPKGITKGSGMLEIAEHYGIPRERTMGFGDGSNDIEMLQEAAVGVAMENSIDKVKAHADQVTKYPNTEEGVAKHLIEYFNLDIKY